MFKFHFNKVYNYTKGKSVIELIALFWAFGVLLPMFIVGLGLVITHMLTYGVDGVTFGIYGQQTNTRNNIQYTILYTIIRFTIRFTMGVLPMLN